jgi:hypothetical protein
MDVICDTFFLTFQDIYTEVGEMPDAEERDSVSEGRSE